MPEQPDECLKHHMMLKNALDNLTKEFNAMITDCKKMRCFLFGGIEQQDGHLSFVDKVNTMYENQKNSRALMIAFISIFGVLFITSLVGLGIQINKLDSTVNTLAGVVQKQQNIEVEIAKLNAKVNK